GARRVLDVGAGLGDATLALARAVGSDGVVYAHERNGELAAKARAFLAQAGLAERVQLLDGDAVAAITNAGAGPGSLGELALIVAVRAGPGRYPALLPAALPRLRAGGLLVAEHVFQRGKSFAPAVGNAAVAAVQAALATLIADAALVCNVLPLGDGLAVAWKP